MTTLAKISKPYILIVDDDRQTRFMIREALEIDDYQVEEVGDGVAAMEICELSCPVIILLDVMMPVMDGFATCKAMRQHPKGGHIPIIMMTGTDDLSSIQKAYDSGATDFVTKPIDYVILGHRIRYMLRALKTQDELQNKNLQLAKAALEKEKAEESSRIKSQFLSNVSHELNTPMNAVLGFAQLLMKNPKEPLTPLQHNNVQKIITAGEHLLRLTNDILDLSRIERGMLEVNLDLVNLADVITDSFTLIASFAEKHQIKLNETNDDKSIFVMADFTRLKQVMVNLLSNAVKYNKPNGEISVRYQLQGSVVKIEVQDTGHGLSDAQQKVIFDPFTRLEHHEIDGTGIGLTISHHLMSLMGGKMGVDSVVGEGSTFWLLLSRQ